MPEKPRLGALFPKKKKRRRGNLRIIVHIALFAVLGALLLALGLYGNALLDAKTESLRDDTRINSLHAAVIRDTQAAMNAVCEDQTAQRQINTGISGKKNSLKKTIAASLAEGGDGYALALSAVDTLLAGVEARLKDETALAAVQKTVLENREKIADAVWLEAQTAAETLAPDDVRKTLDVKAENYPLMYYHTALMALGAAFLAAFVVLLFLFCTKDAEGRVKIADFLEPMDYLLPFFVGVGVFTLYPMVRVVVMSFQERYVLTGSFSGWGVGNYAYVINGVPGTTNYFMQGLRNTLVYVALTIPLSTVISIVLAWLLNQKLKYSALFQTAYFLPMVTSVTAVGLVWRWMFNQNFGLINAFLNLFGVPNVNWLLQASNSMAVLVIFGVWSSLPFTIILLLSGLQNIDDKLYTVARVDGSKTFRIFRRITLPLLSPTIGLVLIINSISAFKVFTDVKVLFNGYAGPSLNMYTVVYYIYEQMYTNLELGRAAAAAIILFLFIFAFTMLQRVIQRKWNYQ